MNRALIIDDDQRWAADFAATIGDECGIDAVVATTVSDAVRTLESSEIAVVFLDLMLDPATNSQAESIQLLRWLRRHRPATQVVIVTYHAEIPHVVETVSEGALDFLPKPLGDHITRLGSIVRKAIELHQALLIPPSNEFAIVGQSAAIQDLRERIVSVSRSPAPTLIVGEPGTGKELVARAIHNLDSRSEHPFVPLLAPAIPESLFERELFGHVRGAFTSASQSSAGAFEAAGEGTLFLDEISELPLTLQSKLLRVLQTGDFSRVGEQRLRRSQCRIVAASNREISELTAGGHLRQDLFDRLAVLLIQVPSLRSRKDDIPLLARHFIKKHAGYEGISMPSLDESALACLLEHDYPGNVRELENIIHRSIVFSAEPLITREILQQNWIPSQEAAPGASSFNLKAATKRAERDTIHAALTVCNDNRTEAAKRLGISRQRLHVLLKEHGIGTVVADDSATEPSTRP